MMQIKGLAVEETTPHQRIQPGPFSRPSLQAVYRALGQAPARMSELVAKTGYARRTVASALRDLEAMGILRSRPDLTDTRRTWFWIEQGPNAPDPVRAARQPPRR